MGSQEWQLLVLHNLVANTLPTCQPHNWLQEKYGYVLLAALTQKT